MHHVTVDLLWQAYHWLKRSAASGVDGVTRYDYEENLEAKLIDLHTRLHRGSYHPLPSRRKYIAKPDGRWRPPGIAALEDKIVQRAVVEVLNAIYEQDFLGFSYEFRPGRGQHDALDALAVGISQRHVNWILDADIAAYFDTVSHDWMLRLLEHRIGGRCLLRLISKWLKAGVMEEGVVTAAETGTPEGAVVSPMLANVYLHYVFDLWAHRWRQHEARGAVIFVRYADDVVAGFEHEGTAKRLADMRQRMAKFALSLHPDKTRLIEFGRFAAERRAERGLGTTHARPHPATGAVAAASGARLLCIPRRANQPPQSGGLSVLRGAPLAEDAAASRPEGPFPLGPAHPTRSGMASLSAYSSPVAGRPLCRQPSKVRAQCLNRARWDLCGGQQCASLPRSSEGVHRRNFRP